MRRKENITSLLADMGAFREHTEAVLDKRIVQPLPGQVVPLSVDQLDPDPSQPRRNFPENSLRELANSIREQGVLQALIVRPTAGGRFKIVAGERRFRAARLAGLATVPCLVQTYSDQQARIVALVENIHREDLSDVEKSDALWALKDLTGQAWADVAKIVALSVDRVKHLSRFQSLAEPVKEQVRTGVLSGFKARTLLPLDPGDQIALGAQAAISGWSAEELQEKVQQHLGRAPRRKPRHDSNRDDGSVLQNTSPSMSAIVELHAALDESLLILAATGAGILGSADREALLTKVERLREILLGS